MRARRYQDGTYLGHLPLVSLVGVFGIVRQRLWSRKFMVTRRRRADVSLASNLSCEPRHRAGHCTSRGT